MERKKGEAKGREFFYLTLLILLILLMFIKRDGKKEKAEPINSEKKFENVQTATSSSEPVIKLHLLRERNILEKSQRNIFHAIKPNINPPPPEPGIEEKIEEELIIPFKLVGIIENSNSEKTRYAFLSKDGDVISVKKGDILDNELEVLEVEDEGVIIKSLKNSKTKRLEFEGK